MACLAPMIDRSILREVKSGPYMLKAGFQKGSMELRTCPLDVSPLACVSDLPWRLVAAQHPPPYPEALKFHVKCNFMKFQPPDPGFHEMVHPYPSHRPSALTMRAICVGAARVAWGIFVRSEPAVFRLLLLSLGSYAKPIPRLRWRTCANATQRARRLSGAG